MTGDGFISQGFHLIIRSTPMPGEPKKLQAWTHYLSPGLLPTPRIRIGGRCGCTVWRVPTWRVHRNVDWLKTYNGGWNGNFTARFWLALPQIFQRQEP